MDKLHKIVEDRKRKLAESHIYEDRSKERLWAIVKGKCETIMIGALSEFEEKFGRLWAHGDQNKTDKQAAVQKIWKECRKEILDNGNSKIRDLKKEIDEYSVSWTRKNYEAKIERKDNQ